MPQSADTPVWRIKVALQDSPLVVWRRFETYSNVTLAQLHYLLQAAMGWDLAHLYSFSDGAGYGLEISPAMVLDKAFKVGDSLTYLYDFGDEWRHLVTIEEEVTPNGAQYPRCVSGRNACPPEDCGGTAGYRSVLRVLAGRRNARRRELIDWLGRFDPKAFTITEANQRLAEYSTLATPPAP